jgi:uncharacterized protein (TIGR03083 family)
MNPAAWLSVLRTEGTTFAACLDRGDHDALVPGCPDWDLSQLGGHLGFIHRNVARALEAPPDEPMKWAPVDEPGSSAELGAWSRAGLELVLAGLSSGSPDDPVATFLGTRTRRWWQRRQAHETSVHRWDAQSAIGVPDPIDPELAVDGIDELFEVFVSRIKPERFGDLEATLHLHATDTDGEWSVNIGPDAIRVDREHRKGDVAARGSASDLLLFLYGRLPSGRLEVFGDTALLNRWQAVARP